MATVIDNLNNKIENGGITTQGRLSAAEFNALVTEVINLISLSLTAAYIGADDGEGNYTTSEGEIIDLSTLATKAELALKQNILQSGVNIKTINGTSLLGSGNISISGGSGSGGGDANVIESITFNGEPVPVDENKNAEIVFIPDLSDYLSLSGGTMTGNLIFDNSDNYIGYDSTNDGIIIDAGNTLLNQDTQITGELTVGGTLYVSNGIETTVSADKSNSKVFNTNGGVVDISNFLTSHQDITGKADKSSTVTNVAWSTSSKKLIMTINGVTTDIATQGQLTTNCMKTTGIYEVDAQIMFNNSGNITGYLAIDYTVSTGENEYFSYSTSGDVECGVLDLWNVMLYGEDNDSQLQWEVFPNGIASFRGIKAFQTANQSSTKVFTTNGGILDISNLSPSGGGSGGADTKNTAGATEVSLSSSENVYLVGAKEQTANPQTYSKGSLFYSTNIFNCGFNNIVIGESTSLGGDVRNDIEIKNVLGIRTIEITTPTTLSIFCNGTLLDGNLTIGSGNSLTMIGSTDFSDIVIGTGSSAVSLQDALDAKAPAEYAYTTANENYVAIGDTINQCITELDDAMATKVGSSDITSIVKITQADYDLLSSPSSTTLYIIIPASS